MYCVSTERQAEQMCVDESEDEKTNNHASETDREWLIDCCF
jgi:hypothetical protein